MLRHHAILCAIEAQVNASVILFQDYACVVKGEDYYWPEEVVTMRRRSHAGAQGRSRQSCAAPPGLTRRSLARRPPGLPQESPTPLNINDLILRAYLRASQT